MAAIRLTEASKYNTGEFAALRAIAIDLARSKIGAVPALTDNSTGVAAASIVDLAVPTAKFDATAAGGATATAFNAALTVFENVGKVLTNSFNVVRTKLGLPLLVAQSGTEAAANTIPAMTKTVATTNGATSLDYAEGRARMEGAKRNLNDLVNGYNEIMKAVGMPTLINDLGNVDSTDDNLEAIADAAAAVNFTSAVSKAAVDAFLTGLANNIATIATEFDVNMAAAITQPSSIVAA
jgi:hypothetical protein